MAKQLLGVLALLLVSPFAWSQILDNESSLVIDLDQVTGTWTVECELEVDGIDALDDHFVSASVQYNEPSLSFAITLARSDFEILAGERSKSELTDGQFAFEAKKMGKKLVVGIDLSWPAVGTTEGFICGIGVYQLENGTLNMLANMRSSHSAWAGY